MLKLIHKYQRSILAYFLIAIMCLSMLLFGIDALAPNSGAYAVKIDDEEIPFSSYARKRQEIENFYQQTFGPKAFAQYVENGTINPGQQALDAVIPAFLLKRKARELGFTVTPNDVRKAIASRFGTAKRYEQYLNQVGTSPQVYEASLSEDLLANQIKLLVDDFSTTTPFEARAEVMAQNTAYSFDYLTFAPAKLKDEIEAPSEDILQEFFDENAADFEEGEQISYRYIVVSPESIADQIEISDEDIDLYYSDHTSDFVSPASATAQSIVIEFDPNGPEEEQAATRALAQEALGKAYAGEDFAALVTLYASDVASHKTAGDLGTVTAETKPALVSEAILALEGPGFTEVIETDKALHIVKVNTFEPEREKDLKEVKDEIVDILRKEEGPAYASGFAQDYYDEWIEAGGSLEDYAKEKGLTIKNTEGRLQQRETPEPSVRGLTAMVLDEFDVEQQLHELRDSTVLVEVVEFKERTIPELSEIKDEVIAKYQEQEGEALAQQRADEALALLEEGKTLQEVAEQLGTEVREAKELVKSKGSFPQIFADQQVVRKAFRLRKAGDFVRSTLTALDQYHVVALSSITPPAQEEIEEKLQVALQGGGERNATILLQSLIAQLKAGSEIRIQPGLVGQS